MGSGCCGARLSFVCGFQSKRFRIKSISFFLFLQVCFRVFKNCANWRCLSGVSRKVFRVLFRNSMKSSQCRGLMCVRREWLVVMQVVIVAFRSWQSGVRSVFSGLVVRRVFRGFRSGVERVQRRSMLESMGAQWTLRMMRGTMVESSCRFSEWLSEQVQSTSLTVGWLFWLKVMLSCVRVSVVSLQVRSGRSRCFMQRVTVKRWAWFRLLVVAFSTIWQVVLKVVWFFSYRVRAGRVQF